MIRSCNHFGAFVNNFGGHNHTTTSIFEEVYHFEKEYAKGTLSKMCGGGWCGRQPPVYTFMSSFFDQHDFHFLVEATPSRGLNVGTKPRVDQS